MLCATLLLWNCVAGDDAKDTTDQQKWQGLCLGLQIVLPLAGLAFFLGYGGFLPSLMLQIDRCCFSVFCASLSKRDKLLRWVSNRLPWTWSFRSRSLTSGVTELWKDGSLLCTLINSAVPGACPNPHRHWRKAPLHAQALAYKYLDLAPIFTDEDFKGELSVTQEGMFVSYLQKLQQTINKLHQEEDIKYSSQYIARGMGLYTGEQHRKTVFYVYSDTIGVAQKRSGVLIHIRGPYNTQGKATIPAFHNLQKIPVVCQMEASKLLPNNSEEQKWFLKTISLDFTSLITANNEEKSNDIPLKIDMELNRAKVTYIPNNTGIYELNLITNGELLKGSPYYIRITENLTKQREVFEQETEDVEDRILIKKKRTLSKVIDCIDEIIQINEGNLNTPEENEDDVTIMQITKNDEEIVKTEISCTLEQIREENHDNISPKEEQIVIESNESIFVMEPQNLIDCVDNFTDLVKIDVAEQNARFEHKNEEDIEANLIGNKEQPLKIQINPHENPKVALKENNKFTKRIISFDNVLYVDYERSPDDENNNHDTPPICSEHIRGALSANEKRKIFGTPQPEFSQSENEDLTETDFHSLNSTLSLPEFFSVKHRKAFWERKILSSTESLDKIVPDKNLYKNLSHKNKVDKYKFQLSKSTSTEESDYNASATTADNFKLMSLKERKRMLMEKVEKEERKIIPKKLNTEKKSFDTVDAKTSPKETFSRISDRINQFDKNLPKKDQNDNKNKRNNLKAQFRRAFNFFKNLEDPKSNKTSPDIKRRHSLDAKLNNSKANKTNKSGSLSERFSINNLYDDVFGSWKGGFKGTPNKKGVIESLSSFGENTESLVLSEKIKYNLFANKTRTKKRKSLKSIFDVNY